MRAEEITLAIFEKYTPEELAVVAKDMALAQTEMETAENEKKVSDGVFNERIKAHGAKVSELAQKYNKGGETAQIGCTIRYDIPEVGKKSYIRMDTEETVEVHDMTEIEKQETFQFPLTASPDKTTNETETPSPTPESQSEPSTPSAQSPSEPPTEEVKRETVDFTFKDIQSITKHLIAEPETRRAPEIVQWETKIAAKMMATGKTIGPDGRIETVATPEVANSLAHAWLTLAIDELLKPKPAEEVTRLCPYPGCILFAEHDGDHDFPPADAPQKVDTAVEPQFQKAEEPKKRRGRPAKLKDQDAILPDPRKDEPPSPGAQA